MENLDLLSSQNFLFTISPWQQAKRAAGEQTNHHAENIIQLISHPQCEDILTYKSRLVGEHRWGAAEFHSQATPACYLENIFTIEAMARELTWQATFSEKPRDFPPKS